MGWKHGILQQNAGAYTNHTIMAEALEKMAGRFIYASPSKNLSDRAGELTVASSSR